jgi:drug/metabolite transporter (DMT)-like permease
MHIFGAYPGQAFALLTAVTWAFAVILFKKSGEAVHPIGLNLFKDVLALVLFIPTVWLWGTSHFRPAPIEDYLLLFASGALGIGIADTLFFKSLNILGAGLSAIVDCLYSPFIIGLSMLYLGESLSVLQIAGVVMIISAVLAVTRERRTNAQDKKMLIIGLLLGAAAMATNALGIVMIKPLLDRSPLLWVTEMRMFGGVLVLLIMLAFHPARRAILNSIRAPQRWGYTLSGSLVGGYTAILLWLAGMKFTQASTASALNQTSNIFIFVFAGLFLKERINAVRVIGIILGVSGAILVTFG